MQERELPRSRARMGPDASSWHTACIIAVQFPTFWGRGYSQGAAHMDDELMTPIATAPEDLFAELREQTTVTLLSGGLLRYTDPSFASAAPFEETETEDRAAD